MQFQNTIIAGIATLAAALSVGASAARAADTEPARTADSEFVIQNFRFASGETLPELRIHYTVLGKPRKDAQGHVVNAVLGLHGTGGSGHSLLNEHFAGVLFQPGQLLDAKKYYIILPDGIGSGKSSKPSDGLHTRFPKYAYADMVAAQYQLLTKWLGVDHLRLIIGTSMGCMHSFVWGETYPDFMDALMPLACLPVQLAGRNRLWREVVMDAIRADPQWNKGDYTTEPQSALRTAAALLMVASSAPIQMQLTLPTRDAADEFAKKYMERQMADLDANDLLYQLDSSRDYDPSKDLEKIKAPLLQINSADDFINPPELGIAEREIKRVPKGRFILLPASEQTHGHGTHTWAAVWQQYLAQLLESSKTPENSK